MRKTNSRDGSEAVFRAGSASPRRWDNIVVTVSETRATEHVASASAGGVAVAIAVASTAFPY